MTNRLPKHLHDALTAARRADQLIHGYDRVVAPVIVDTVRRDLPRLRALLEVELKRFPLD